MNHRISIVESVGNLRYIFFLFKQFKNESYQGENDEGVSDNCQHKDNRIEWYGDSAGLVPLRDTSGFRCGFRCRHFVR